MKLAITCFALALSSQALADCTIEQPAQTGANANSAAAAATLQAVTAAQHRQLVLDCMMRPAPFTQEPLLIELDELEDEFIEEADAYPETGKSVAANS